MPRRSDTILRELQTLWRGIDQRGIDRRFFTHLLLSLPVLIPGALFFGLLVEGAEIGRAVARYGPFRLHRYALALRGGGRLPLRQYMVVLGDMAVPVRMPWRARGKPGDEGSALGDALPLGTVPVARCGPADVYARVRAALHHHQALGNLMGEWVPDETILTAGQREVVARRAPALARMATRADTLTRALDQFAREYPAAVAAETATGRDDARAVAGAERRWRSLCAALLVAALPAATVLVAGQRLARRLRERRRAGEGGP